MSMLPYIILVQNIYSFIAAIYIVFTSTRILIFFKKNTLKNSSLINSPITPTILLHIFTWNFRSILTVISQIYFLINWNPTFLYNFDVYFYFSSIDFIVTFAIHIPPLLIAIERIIIIFTNPILYLKIRFYFIIVGFLLQFCLCVISGFIYFNSKIIVVDNTIKILQNIEFLECWASTCMLSFYGAAIFSYGKMFLSIVYLIIATICLIVLFKWKHKHSHSKYSVGKLVHQTIYSEFAFILFPNFISSFFRYILGTEISDYGGNFIKIGIITDGLFNSYIISNSPTFKNKTKNQTIIAHG